MLFGVCLKNIYVVIIKSLVRQITNLKSQLELNFQRGNRLYMSEFDGHFVDDPLSEIIMVVDP